MRRLARGLVSVARRVNGAAAPAPSRSQPTGRRPTTREPLILLDDDPLPDEAVVEVSPIASYGTAPSIDRSEDPPGRFRSRLRRLTEVVLFSGLGLALVVAYQVMDPGGSAADGAADGAADRTARPVTSPDGPRSLRPMLIAPATARPGEMVTLLGYRYRDLSGDLTVFLDGVPIGHKVTATINAPYPGLDGVILVIEVPSTMTPGVHDIELTGPLPGRRSRGGEIRGDTDQRDGRIATTKLTIVPHGYKE